MVTYLRFADTYRLRVDYFTFGSFHLFPPLFAVIVAGLRFLPYCSPPARAFTVALPRFTLPYFGYIVYHITTAGLRVWPLPSAILRSPPFHRWLFIVRSVRLCAFTAFYTFARLITTRTGYYRSTALVTYGSSSYAFTTLLYVFHFAVPRCRALIYWFTLLLPFSHRSFAAFAMRLPVRYS